MCGTVLSRSKVLLPPPDMLTACFPSTDTAVERSAGKPAMETVTGVVWLDVLNVLEIRIKVFTFG